MSTSLWFVIGLVAFISLGGLGWIIKAYHKVTDGTKVDIKVIGLRDDLMILGREFPKSTEQIRSSDIAKILIWMNNGALGSGALIDSPTTDIYKEYVLVPPASELVAFCKRNNVTCIGEEQETGARVELNKGINLPDELNFFATSVREG